ncbi:MULTISPECIES: hypothetical protein [unclassified Streptomyces]|uniref:hypothetical protein n=1 Tax=unclassified Streptomyces TaxID=2593676 RepID=UPI0003761BD6|nr:MULTISPECIES: hypothetical protein [unclassified Streptomyces]MYY00817.1 hypothetical protein [Streptomyces sp. SID4913]
MGRSKHLITAFTVTAVGAALLTGCSSDDPDTDAAGPTASSPAASPSAVASSPAPQESEATEYVEPAECASLGLASDKKLAGKDLAACVTAAFAAYGTGTEYMLTKGRSGTTRFRVGDDPALAGDVDGSDGERAKNSFVSLGGEEWIKSDGAWERSDSKEAMDAELGDKYRTLSDPQVVSDIVGTFATWKVDTEKALISLENGKDTHAWRITNAAHFDYQGAEMTEYILWIEDDGTPVGAQSTSHTGGAPKTVSQHFYDLGEPVTIEAPAV